MNIGQKYRRHIQVLCSLLGYSRQSYYQGQKVIEEEVLHAEVIVQEVIKHRATQQKVGTRKLYLHLQPFLQAHHISIGRDALFNLLAENNLLIRKRKRNKPITTFSGHWMHKYPNLIIGFEPDKAHQLLVSDITYLRLTDGGFVYLSLITDAYSRKITGHYVSKTLCAASCIKALRMAIKQLPKDAAPIHHSDRGSQYCSYDYVGVLLKNHFSISMTQSGDPRENAIAERVNGVLKTELLKDVFESPGQAVNAVSEAVSIYNNTRLHSSVEMLTPAQAHLKTGKLKRKWKHYYTKTKEVAIMQM
jgi:transposase InsO family protein